MQKSDVLYSSLRKYRVRQLLFTEWDALSTWTKMLISVSSSIVGNVWDNVGTGAELNKLYYKGVTKKCYLLYLQIQGKEKSQCFFTSSIHAWSFRSQCVIVLNNRDLNVDKNKPDYVFCRSQAALLDPPHLFHHPSFFLRWPHCYSQARLSCRGGQASNSSITAVSQCHHPPSSHHGEPTGGFIILPYTTLRGFITSVYSTLNG